MSDAEKQEVLDVQTMISALNAEPVFKPLESSKHWSGLDPEAQVILQKLLDPDPEKRLTADQVLQEPWLYAAQGLPYPSASPSAIPEAQVTDGAESTTTLLDRMAELQTKFLQQQKVSHLETAPFPH